MINNMAKGWKLVATSALDYGNTETRQEKIRRFHKFDNLIRNTLTEKEEILRKQSEKRFLKAKAEEEQLLQAFRDKKLKSKALIKRAKALNRKLNKAETAPAT